MTREHLSISRRKLISIGSLGLIGAAIGQTASSPEIAFASESFNTSSICPEVVVSANILKTGEPATKLRLKGQSAGEACSKEGLAKLEELTINSFGKESRINVLASLGLSSVGQYTEETKEADESIQVQARIMLGVLWGEEKTSIQITKGVFEVSQAHPLVSYSNAFYAIMQKSRYMGDSFNGKELTLEPNWPSDSYDEDQDQWTCGAGVGALAFNMMTGEEYNFTVDLYL